MAKISDRGPIVGVLTTIHSVTRRLNSPSGNPRFTLDTGVGQFNTSTDSDCNYGVREDGQPHKAKLTLDRAGGEVIGIEYY